MPQHVACGDSSWICFSKPPCQGECCDNVNQEARDPPNWALSLPYQQKSTGETHDKNHKVKKARVMSQHCLSKHFDFHISSLFANKNVEYNFYDNSLYKSKLNINALKCTHCEQS